MKYAILALKGVAYGVTNLVPAIGGGTILILLGIYEEFVDAFGNLLNWRRWKDIVPFLVALLGGAAVGMIGLSKLINSLLENHEAPTMLFFIGLLVATIPGVLKMHRDMRLTAGRAVAFLVGVAIVAALKVAREQILEAGRQTTALEVTNLASGLYYVATSFLAGCASVTPGMDGSSIFMLAGTYKPITGALSALAQLDIRWATILFTALGAGPGIILFSRLVGWAIQRAPSVIYYGVLGIIVGSVYGLWPAGLLQANLLVSVVAAVVGLAIGFLFNRPREGEQAS